MDLRGWIWALDARATMFRRNSPSNVPEFIGKSTPWETTLVGTNWTASNGAKFNLNTNGLRPDGWTSGDAGGLPTFPALVRYDEFERGMVEHACRLVVVHSRQSHIYPATHNANGIPEPIIRQ